MLLRKLNRVSGCLLVSLNVSCGCRLRAPIAIRLYPGRGRRGDAAAVAMRRAPGQRRLPRHPAPGRTGARDAILRRVWRVPAPSARAATDAPCSLSARHIPILPCPRARPALCRLTLCCPPSQVVSTSRRGVGGTMWGWGACWVAVTVDSGHFGGAWLSARVAVWRAAPTRRRGCAARLRGAGR